MKEANCGGPDCLVILIDAGAITQARKIIQIADPKFLRDGYPHFFYIPRRYPAENYIRFVGSDPLSKGHMFRWQLMDANRKILPALVMAHKAFIRGTHPLLGQGVRRWRAMKPNATITMRHKVG